MTSLDLLRAGGDRPALLLVHPSSGDCADYAPLVTSLAHPGPIHGIDAPGLRGGQPFAGDLLALSAAYARLWRDTGGAGPVALAGWGVGGVIAAEVSHDLCAAGCPVSLVVIFDARAPAPEMRTRVLDDRALAAMFAASTARWRGRELDRPPEDASAAAVVRALAGAGALPPGWDEEAVARRCAVFGTTARALFAHEMRAIYAPVLLFESTEEHPRHPKPPTLGWEAHARSLQRVPAAGTHYTILSAEHAPALARELDAALRGSTSTTA